MAEVGIKDILEVCEFCESAGIALKAALADGHTNFKDLLLPEVRAAIPKLSAAAQGLQNIPAQAANIDAAEIAQIYTAVVKAASALADAFLGLKLD